MADETCALCQKSIEPGQPVATWEGKEVHQSCLAIHVTSVTGRNPLFQEKG
jgi:hypothetical protein